MIKLSHFLILIMILLVSVTFLPSNYEPFSVQFGTPEGTSDGNAENIKGLLEIGSQALEDTTFDTVSTEILGESENETETVIPTPPPDPVCFTEDDDDDLKETYIPTSLKTYSPACCQNREVEGLMKVNQQKKFQNYESGDYFIADKDFNQKNYLNDYEDWK